MTDAEKKDIKELIMEGFKTQREWIEAILHPIQKDVDKHTIMIQKVPMIEQKLDNHIETHSNKENSKKFNIEMWVIIGVYLLDKVMAYIKA